MCVAKTLFKKYVNGTLTPAERDIFKSHLKTNCPSCDEFFASEPVSKRVILDALFETELSRNRDDISYDRVKKREMYEQIISHKKPSRLRAILGWLKQPLDRPVAAFAMSAMIVAGVWFLLFLSKSNHDTGIKGFGDKPAIILNAQYADYTDDGPKILGTVENDLVLSVTKRLLFTFEIANAGYVYLFSYNNNRNMLIFPLSLDNPEFFSIGIHDLKINNRIAAFPLRNIEFDGRSAHVQFCAVVSKIKFKSIPSLERRSDSCKTIVLEK